MATGENELSSAKEDWSLLVGRMIELKQDGKCIRTAKVEDATADSSIMWLSFDGVHTRQLITDSDGYEIDVVD